MNSKRKLFILISLIVGLIFTGSLIADTSIFFCEESSAYGAAWGVPLDQARKTAREYCEQNGGTNCQELLYCQGVGFAAIATDDEGTIGASCGANSQREADQLALASCRGNSGNPNACKVKHRWRG